MKLTLRPAFPLVLTLLGLFLLIIPELRAQQDDPYEGMGGHTYLIALPDTVTNTQDARFPDRDPESFVLQIYSEVDQQILIGRAGGAGKWVPLVGGKVYEFDLKEVGVPLVTIWNQVDRSKVIELKAEERVIVYAYYSSRFGTAAFTPLSVDLWGTEYFAASWPGDVVRNIYPAGEFNYDASEKAGAPAEIMIISAYDNTEVAITPTADLYQCNGCGNVTLNAGEAYIVQSWVDLRDGVDEQRDIAGTYIESSKPIGVVSANTRSQVEPLELQMLAGNSPKDQMAEWLVPIDHHGREFVYTPDPLGRRASEEIRTIEEIRLVAGLDSTRVRFHAATGDSLADELVLGSGEFVEVTRNSSDGGVRISASESAQAFKAIAGSAMFNGTTGSGNYIGASYRAWGSAMVEIVPRERWTRFAAVRAPSIPSDFSHYLTIVTDSVGQGRIKVQKNSGGLQPVDFPEHIEGTDIHWTRFPVDPGATYRITGDGGARFTGHMYGEQQGYELYRPGSTEKDGDVKENRSSAIRHPSEYEESVGSAYAYPFPSPYYGDTTAKEYLTDTTYIDCHTLTVRVRTADGSPLELGTIRRSSDTRNSGIEDIQLIGGSDLQTATEALVEVRRIDTDEEGQGEILFRRPRSEVVISRQPFRFDDPEVITVMPTTLQFADSGVGSRGEVRFVNDGEEPVELERLMLAGGTKVFSIVETLPDTEWRNPSIVDTLAPGDTLRVRVEFRGDPDRLPEYEGALVAEFRCTDEKIQLIGTIVEACLAIGDLDFGSLRFNESKTLPLEICNTGFGVARFDNVPVPVLWELPQYFSIPAAELDRLRDASLEQNECITIFVTFTGAEESGVLRTVARFLADPVACRDTSIWRAKVEISSVSGEESLDGYRFGSLTPNPTGGELHLSYEIPRRGMTTITLVDVTGLEIELLYEGIEETGRREHLLDLDRLPSGLYYLRVRSGTWERIEVVHVVR